MKLEPIKKEHIMLAAEYIDVHGIPDNYIYNNYWIQLPNKKEYPFKYLTRIAFQMTDNNKGIWLDFESTANYRKYIHKNLSFPINYYKEDINFITKEDIDHFETIGGKKYRKENEEDKRNAQLLKPLVYKVNKWAENSLIENFIPRLDYYWQWSGTFKPYLWVRLYRKGSSKKVFFVLGVTSDGGIYYKLDCLRSNYTKSGILPIELQEAFDKHLQINDYVGVSISKHSLKNYNWEKLTIETTRFLYKYASLYDEFEAIISSSNFKKEQEFNRFVHVPPPKKTKTYINKKRTFIGHITDWSQKQSTSKILGDSGENLVIEFERKKLYKVGLFEKIDLIGKAKDGCGYDILSFDIDGNEIHIEVKTTTGDENEPFYLSINEKEYLEQYPESYYLYRLHEFRFNPERSKYYILSANEFLKKAEFNPTNFEVSIIDR